MGHTTSILKNEKGAVVIMAAVMILVLMTIIGIASVNISNTEVGIAGHEIVYLQNFYVAEGAAIECTEMLEGIDDPNDAGFAWLETTVGAITDDNIADKTFWESGNGSVTPQPSGGLADSQFVVAYEGVTTGSLGMGSTKKHGYTIYGRSAPPGKGETLLLVGYLVAAK